MYALIHNDRYYLECMARRKEDIEAYHGSLSDRDDYFMTELPYSDYPIYYIGAKNFKLVDKNELDKFIGELKNSGEDMF